MPALPTGTITVLFTDIEGSTQLLQRLGDEPYAHVLGEYRRILHAIVDAEGGREVESQGDGALIAFDRARAAVRAALAAQRAIIAHPWSHGALRVRMALDTAEATAHGGTYVGLGLHRSQRICAAGWGGQILLSRTTASIVESELPPGASLKDLGEHRLRDLRHPQRIFQLLHADMPDEFPPLRSLENLPNNLPRQLTSFIGREREMADVKRLVSANRLLTLTGSGGCGKTRLAVQVGGDLVETFADGVWFVDFAPLSDPALVPQAVASALRTREEPGRPLLATLTDHLQPKTVLLILDSCEHVVDACARLADSLLRACPHVRIMATSREPLRIPGEANWRVRSLTVPDLTHLPPVNELAENEAVALFVERARAVLPEFRLTEHNAEAVARICHRLDGIPLAIELAATRVKTLSVDQIASRLDDRFRLLTGGSRTAMPRQQTLQAAMDWSYVLLSEQEKALLRRLSVFAGGWTLDAAEAICVEGGIDRGEVLDLLSQLVDRSLVAVDDRDGSARYRLLETLRQYARAKLEESGERPALQSRHLDWFTKLAERAETQLRGPAQAVWLRTLEVDHDNLRAALEWSRSEGINNEAGLRLAGALGRFWWMHGHLTEGRQWLENALANTRGVTGTRGRALLEAGRLAWSQDDHKRAQALCQESLAMFRHLGDEEGTIDALNSLGLVAFRTDFAAARTHFEEALVLSRRLEDRRRTAFLLNNLGLVAGAQGQYESAAELHQESLTLRQELGDRHGVSSSLYNLGLMASARNDNASARGYLERSLEIRTDLGDKLGIANSLNALAVVALRQGEEERAAALLEQSLRLVREVGDRMGHADALSAFARLALRRAQHERASMLGKQCLAIRMELGDKRGVAECLETLSAVAGDQRNFLRAARLLGAAEAIRESIGVPLTPSDRVEYEKNAASVRAALPDPSDAETWSQGRRMTLEQAVEYAVKDSS